MGSCQGKGEERENSVVVDTGKVLLGNETSNVVGDVKQIQEPRFPRFADEWFRQFDNATHGYVDSHGFMNRLPMRLRSTEFMVHGFVDASSMWEEYIEESFLPIRIGEKAVVSVWFNNFVDTDCGGEYYETWYNTFVTPKNRDGGQLILEDGSNPMDIITHPEALIFLQRVVCGDTPRNPGAAMKAIAGGREIFGFPKHPVPGQLELKYTPDSGSHTGITFTAMHHNKLAVKLKADLPEATPVFNTIPIDAKTGPDTVISCPRLGGSHRGHNGAKQQRFGQAFKCTQYVTAWNTQTDCIEFGEDEHYAQPIGRWRFEPILKVHSPDFKIAAFKPVGWIDGPDADAAIAEHERLLAEGKEAGAL